MRPIRSVGWVKLLAKPITAAGVRPRWVSQALDLSVARYGSDFGAAPLALGGSSCATGQSVEAANGIRLSGRSAALAASVIICSHNPRADYLGRVLQALAEQTLSKTSWELLLVDNASHRPLESSWDLCWHPQGRHVREAQVGLVNARISGIDHAKGDLLIFVDDDNLLGSNYLETACRIAKQFPRIGAFGCSLAGEFETTVPNWAQPYLEGLCVKEITRDQ
ncbi:MAG: glycosyltransferase [Xanthobacteraceae bacterium]